jgi:hypothetical protein
MRITKFRRGVDVDRAIEVLQEQAQNAENAANSSPGQSATDMTKVYLRWTETAESQLRNALSVEDVAAIIYTDRHWVLARSRGDEPRLMSMALTELHEQARLLSGVAAELKIQRGRWLDAPGILVVPDTNVFLRPDVQVPDIDWPVAMNSRVDVRLVVPIIVVHELDRLKRQGNSTTAKAARAALRWLNEILPPEPTARSAPWSSNSPTTTIEVYVHDGPSRPDDADGMIIDVTAWLRLVAHRPATKLVTYDLGMRLRANSQGVAVHQFPETE